MFVEITNSVYLVYIYFELVKIYYLFVFAHTLQSYMGPISRNSNLEGG